MKSIDFSQFLLTRSGRLFAALVLCGALAMLHWATFPPLQAARIALFDHYQRSFPRQPHSQPVTLVEIDEDSLRQLGQWPWPRSQLAALIQQINAMKPLVIGLDIYMPEADQTSPEALAARLTGSDAALARHLSALPAHDEQLRAAIAAAPVVLGAAGFDFATLSSSKGLRSFPVQVTGGDALPYLRNYPWVLASMPALQAAASGQAVLSVDLEGGVVRRLPLLLAVNQQPVPSLALEMLRVATGMPHSEIVVDARGVKAVKVADLTVPTLPNGEVWLPFAPASLARSVSAADILAGKADPARFEGKLVLIGLTGLGFADMRSTPLGGLVPGVEIQAQLMESLVDGAFLQRPAWMIWLESAGLLLLAGALIGLAPPRRSIYLLGFCVVAGIALYGAGLLAFRQLGLLLDIAGPGMGLLAVSASLLSSAFVRTERERRAANAALQIEREAAARLAGELAAARRIQLGSLPNAARLFAAEQRFEIGAVLEPARQVGGDLYDFFMLSRSELFFVIGDVSGKGLPASLFMAVTKALAKSVALRHNADTDIGMMLTTVNQELSRENPELLFVTMVAGVLNVDTGALELAVAGHDAPWCINSQGAISTIEVDGGPPLCVLDDFPYTSQHLQLARGDTLLLITDGVTEAMNQERALYGSARLREVVAANCRAATSQTLLAAIDADVARFVAGAEVADDLTLLAIRRLAI